MADPDNWEVIERFASLAEYQRFLEWITEEERIGAAQQVAVTSPYSGSSMWEERWYKNLTTGQTWRLVAPEPPFRGIFKTVLSE